MKVKNQKAWEEFLAVRPADSYEGKIVRWAMQWADRMEVELAKGAKLENIAERTLDLPGAAVILSNTQLVQAIVALVRFWVHGDELQKWREANWQAVRARRGG